LVFLQASEKQEKAVSSQIHSKPSSTAHQLSKEQIESQNLKPQLDREHLKVFLDKEKDTAQERPITKKNRSFEDEELASASIFQKPRLHHSSVSPKENNRLTNSPLVHSIPAGMSVTKLTSTFQNATLDNPTTENNTLESIIPEENIILKSTSTLLSSALEKPRVTSFSLARDVPSQFNSDESMSTLRSCSTVGMDSTNLCTSTMKASLQSSIKAATINESEVNPYDSFASTVLSMAFTGIKIYTAVGHI